MGRCEFSKLRLLAVEYESNQKSQFEDISWVLKVGMKALKWLCKAFVTADMKSRNRILQERIMGTLREKHAEIEINTVDLA